MQQTTYPCLKGLNVLITGGATGIGADLVTAFAGQHCKVIFIDVQDDEGDALCNKLGSNTHYQHCDLNDVKQIKNSVAQIVDLHGPISVLINNAANDDRCSIESIDEDYWDWSQGINAKAQFFMAQAVWPSMRSLGKGSIINFSSIAWRLGNPELTAYATAKAGLLGLTQSLAREFGQHNIRVNALEPGAVMTHKQRKLWYPEEEDVQRMVARQMLNKVISGDDIAQVALFLASDDSSAITGQSWQVDAGFR